MRITYTGRQVELAPAQLRKIQARAAKLAKFLDGKGEREAHVILSMAGCAKLQQLEFGVHQLIVQLLS